MEILPMPTTLSVAILGASSDQRKFGNLAVRAHLRRGYRVFPINPKGGIIEGLHVYRSLAELPERPTRVSIYLPPSVTIELLSDVARIGCDELFLNPGSEDRAVLALAAALGLQPIQACSIVDLGITPDQLDR